MQSANYILDTYRMKSSHEHKWNVSKKIDLSFDTYPSSHVLIYVYRKMVVETKMHTRAN